MIFYVKPHLNNLLYFFLNIIHQGLLERRDIKLPKMGKIIGGLLTFFDLDGKLLEITAKFFQGIGG